MAVNFAKCGVFFIVFLFIYIYVAPLKHCQKGTFQDSTGACKPCADGTFMPLEHHNHRKCYECHKIEDPELEIINSHCNKTSNSVIHCVSGYYRRLPRNPQQKERCEKCSVCRYEILPCRTYEDTHCCQGENYDVAPNIDGVPVCWEKPWLCRKGEFFNVDSFECDACPGDTYMPMDYHTMTECMKCHTSSQNDLPKHTIITEPCNKTHQAQLACEEGFYINHFMGHNKRKIGCAPCKICNVADGLYEGRKCEQTHDTICCAHPNMTVVDASNGPECRLPSTFSSSVAGTRSEMTVCAEDQYLHEEPDDSNRSATCRPCTPGTFLDLSNHTETVCKKCEDFEITPRSCLTRQTDNDFKLAVGFTVSGIVNCLIVVMSVFGAVLFFVRYYLPRQEKKKLPLNRQTDEVQKQKLLATGV